MEPGRAPVSVLLLLLCGLPASGKSTFARTLRDAHERRARAKARDRGGARSDSNGASVPARVVARFDDLVQVDYDALARKALESRGDGSVGGGATGTEADDSPFGFGPDDLAAWRTGRVRALEMLKKALARAGEAGSSLLVVMDDNFHLRSMRREVYRACQEMLVEPRPSTSHQSRIEIGFATLYFSSSLEVCLQRNDSRSGKERIPVDVITRMASVMEPPDETKTCASCDRFHVKIFNSDTLFDEANVMNGEATCRIDDCFQQALQCPVLPKYKPSQEEIAQLARQREETLKCRTQRVDQLLRRLVGAVGRVDKKRSREANNTRKAIMETVRVQAGGEGSGDDAIVRQFAHSMLGAEMNHGGDSPDAPLARAIRDAVQEFLKAG